MPDFPQLGAESQREAPEQSPSDRTHQVRTVQYDIATRTAIDLATGILMEQRGIGAEEALALLEHLADVTTVEDVTSVESVTRRVEELQADGVPRGRPDARA